MGEGWWPVRHNRYGDGARSMVIAKLAVRNEQRKMDFRNLGIQGISMLIHNFEMLMLH
jgi:hypothetical protein